MARGQSVAAVFFWYVPSALSLTFSVLGARKIPKSPFKPCSQTDFIKANIDFVNVDNFSTLHNLSLLQSQHASKIQTLTVSCHVKWQSHNCSLVTGSSRKHVESMGTGPLIFTHKWSCPFCLLRKVQSNWTSIVWTHSTLQSSIHTHTDFNTRWHSWDFFFFYIIFWHFLLGLAISSRENRGACAACFLFTD